jgi:hypothetical protein
MSAILFLCLAAAAAAAAAVRGEVFSSACFLLASACSGECISSP